MVEVRVNITGTKRRRDDLRGVFHIALSDLHPQVVKVSIIQLQIGGIQTDEIGIMRVVIEQTWKVIPVRLEDDRCSSQQQFCERGGVVGPD